MSEIGHVKSSRRWLLAGVGAALLSGAAYFGGAGHLWQPAFAGADLSAPEAFDLALAGRITLVDIRRPDEWARTGIGGPAQALDMRRADFAEALGALVGGDRAAPIALICARGVRSARLAQQLATAGFTQILDVPEGMLGSRSGPGWLARGLPLRPAS